MPKSEWQAKANANVVAILGGGKPPRIRTTLALALACHSLLSKQTHEKVEKDTNYYDHNLP